MQRNVSATVVAVVGSTTDVLGRLAAPNVRVVSRDAGAGRDGRTSREVGDAISADPVALRRAIAAWSEATRTHRPYVVHDADPLALVADAWVALYEGAGARGELEVAAGAVRDAWRRRQVELPDYYLVADADTMPTTRRHWYLGVLVELAPHRVVPVAGTSSAMLAAIGRLPSGRWWPDLDRLLEHTTQVVPDRFGAATDDDAAGPTLIG